MRLESPVEGLNLTLMRKMAMFLAVLLLAILAGPASSQSSPKWTPDSILTMMDHAALDFHSLTANIERIKYTDVVKDTSTEFGQLWLRKPDNMLFHFAKPDPRTARAAGVGRGAFLL